MPTFGRKVPLSRGAAGLALLLPAALTAARAAFSGGASGDAALIENPALAALNVSCYFAETPVSCRAASEAAPPWLASELPALSDCLLDGQYPEGAVWAFAFRDAALFLRAARGALRRPRDGQARAAARLAPDFSALREDLAARLDDLDAAAGAAALDGRGALLIARLRAAVSSMDAAVAAARAGRSGDLRAALLDLGLEVDGAHAALAGPAPAGQAAGAPACARLADLDAKPPAADGVRLRRLARAADLYRERGDYAQAALAFGGALSQARALGDDADAQNLHAGLAEAALELGDDARMREHMAAALALARGRGDVFSERALLEDFLARLSTLGKDGDLREAYAGELAALSGPLAGARRGLASGAARLALSDYAGARSDFEQAAGGGSALAALRAGDCARRLGDASGALADYGRAALLARAQGNAGIEAEALFELSGLAQGPSRQAERTLSGQEDLALYSLAGGVSDDFAPDLRQRLLRTRPEILASLEGLYGQGGRWERAERFFSDLLREARRVDDQEGAFLARVYLARARAAGGSPDQGVRTLETALGLLERGQPVSPAAAALFYASLEALEPYWTPALRASAPVELLAWEDSEPATLPFGDPGGPRCAVQLFPLAEPMIEPAGGAR